MSDVRNDAGIQRSLSSPPLSYWTGRYSSGEDRWTSREGKQRLVEEFVTYLGDHAPQGRTWSVLDVGCGAMWLPLLLAESLPLARITGVDLARDAILAAYPDLSNELRTAGIALFAADVLHSPTLGTYEFVIDMGLLHHLVPADWPAYREMVCGAVGKGGALLVHSFHLEDKGWGGGKPPGGHERKGYYCHYHDLASMSDVIGPEFAASVLLERDEHLGHVSCLYAFERLT